MMRMKELTLVLTVVFSIALIVAGCKGEVSKKTAVSAAKPDEVSAATNLVATIPDHHEPTGIDTFLNNKPMFEIYFDDHGRGVAYLIKAAGGARLVHNGQVGNPYKEIHNVVLSPDGRRVAYSAMLHDGRQKMVLDGREGMSFDDVGRPVFSPDGLHLAYKVIDKEILYIVVDDTVSKGFKAYNSEPYFNAGATKVAYSEGADGDIPARLIVTDLQFKTPFIKEASGHQLVVNDDKTRIAAVSLDNDKKKVIEFSFAQPEVVKEGELYEEIAQLQFDANGQVSYAAQTGKNRFLILHGKKHSIPYDRLLPEPLVLRGQSGVVAIKTDRTILYSPQAFYSNGAAEKQYDEIAHFAYSRDGARHAYAAKKGKTWFVVINGKESPAFDFVFKPMFSTDGEKLVFRVRKDGKRFVVVVDASGKVLRQHPAYDMVFDTVFTADGTSVAYGVKDGRQLIWKVEKL